MVFARTDKAASRMSNTIRLHEMEKTYLAVLDGVMPEADGTLIDWLTKDTRTNMVSVTDEAHGKRCVLHYHTLEVQDGMSLVKIRLETGRPHQIRVQFASRGLPLLGDRKYGLPDAGDRKYGLPAAGNRLCLCAVRLAFPHPKTGKNLSFSIDPPFSL